MTHYCSNRQATENSADELQQRADENSSKGFFAAIKKVHGPRKTDVARIRGAEC